MRVKLVVAYDGTKYCGWQVQPNGITIEAVLNKELTALFHKPITVIGASRTDSGVHAEGNVAVFDVDTLIPADKIAYALNVSLPEDIVIQSSVEVPEDFHPRYAKTRKTYEYRILNTQMPMPVRRLDTYFYHYDLNLEVMQEAAKILIGEHDFTSFASIHSQTKSFVRTIYDVKVLQDKNHVIVLRISGNGFLYHMVRIIAGTLIQVGSGRIESEKMEQILQAKNRAAAGPTAPPQGLTLMEIQYEEKS